MQNREIKKLVAYYSYEGNTKLMAEVMADAIGADLLRLKPKKEIQMKGFSKYLWGGSQIVMNRRPELEPLEVDPTEYDLIIIGTPVWAWTFAPPVGSLFKIVDFDNKSMGLFTCHGGQNGKTLIHMKKALQGNKIIGEIDFFEPLSNNQAVAVEKAQQWARELLDKASGEK